MHSIFKKRLLFLGVPLFFLLTHTAPAFDLNQLPGYWKGSILKNIKDSSAGGKLAEGDITTPTDMMFMETALGIAGYARVGTDNLEVWVFEGTSFRWTEGHFEVSSARVDDFRSLPNWVQQELKAAPEKNRLIFKINDCRLLADNKPCEEGKDGVPSGLLTSAVFALHFDPNNRLVFSALYAFDKAQKKRRVLRWYGEKR